MTPLEQLAALRAKANEHALAGRALVGTPEHAAHAEELDAMEREIRRLRRLPEVIRAAGG